MNYARTKIVCTLGPASSSAETITAMVDAGADVFRLNMAHGAREVHERMVSIIREVELQRWPLGILVDLAGPKIRLGQLVEDPYECRRDAFVQFVRGHESTQPDHLVSNFEALLDLLKLGDELLLADGTVQLEVTEKTPDVAVCRITEPGTIRSRQGINLPGSYPELPALTPHDLECLQWAKQQEIDFLSLSFVQTAADVQQLKSLVADTNLPVVAKIEKREAIAALDDIIMAADGIMVARGDLGVEIDVADVPLTQKRIVEICNRLQKPVIVATEMLDSMTNSPRPTRAEANDVANAVLDGTDACMLSGETAIGEYPAETVATMNRIMVKTEALFATRPSRSPAQTNTTGALPITSAVVYGAGRIADQLGAKLVVITTRSGATALTKSNLRDFVPTIGASRDPSVLRRMSIFWGITPLANAPVDSIEELRSFVVKWGSHRGMLESGDHVVFVAGRDTGEFAHNAVSVYTVD